MVGAMTSLPTARTERFEPTPDEILPPLTPRGELACLARALYREGYEEHIAGHISYKQPDGTLLVNPFHLRWDEVRAEHICRIDLDGNVLEGEWFVSLAIQLHLELHKARDDVTVAVHNHPRWGTVWASLQRVPPVHDQTSSLVDNDIVLHNDYGKPVGDANEARDVVESLGDAKAALLAHHGVLVVADNVGAGLRALHEPRMALAHGVARRGGRWRRAHACGGVAAARRVASTGAGTPGCSRQWRARRSSSTRACSTKAEARAVNTRRSNLAELAEHQQRTTTVTFIPDPEPDELFCPIVSVDDHVLEPPHTFVGRLPAKYAADAPRVETDDDGVPWWILEDKRMPILFANGAAGRVLEEWKGASRCSYEEFRPSVSEPVTRLADMDVAGIWASLCFGSTLWGFAGSRFARMRDPELGLASLHAYNDWMIEEWCATDRDRFIPCQLPWLADPELAATEIRRNAARGFRAVSFSENPEGLGFAEHLRRRAGTPSSPRARRPRPS